MAAPKRSFHKELVLNRWMYRFFKGGSLQTVKERLGDDRHEGIDEDGQTLFFHELTRNLFNVDCISIEDLRRYDLNIVGYWQDITRKRNRLEETEMQMKYFQYLSLLFTEIYLNWYFNRRNELLDGLNDELELYNSQNSEEHRFRPFDGEELNKLAFWNATGSGKTLLLHINILQYLHYFQKGNNDQYPDKIILLTPNEGLSHQHLNELDLSGFHFFQLFDKNRNAFRGTIEVIDINKLGDEMGDKTVAVDAFEGNNLVLVDEGHRGTGTAAGAWMSRREVLCRGGFAFEYSATFGQAVAKGFTVEKAEEDAKKKKAKLLFGTASLRKLDDDQLQQLVLTSEEARRARTLATREVYAKSILFDYSYKFFYDDGYGKESLILNLQDAEYRKPDIAGLYFTACLLSFYQQQYLWERNGEKLTEYNIERPLWVFVGNKVADDNSDILAVIKLLAGFLNDEVTTRVWLDDLLHNNARLLDVKGNNIFAGRFLPLLNTHENVDQLYSDILKRLFNAESRQRLKLVNLKSSKGELALQVGSCKAFGLISIGDDAGFFRECDDPRYLPFFDTEHDEMAGSQFGSINNSDTLHLLIGSRKFTEGWSSWRVSTMGLLNMGQGEGTQIIQLFGRGVRFKGKEYSLKRSTPGERKLIRGLHLDKLETLNIFGVNAGYMAQFKKYLHDEGITTSDELITIDIETKNSPCFPSNKLLTIAIRDGYRDNQKEGFKRRRFPLLYNFDEFTGKVKLPHVELDLYPRLEALQAGQRNTPAPTGRVRDTGKIRKETMALFNFDRIYLTIQDFKLQRSMTNLRLQLQRLREFCETGSDDWYTLYIPASELEIRSMADIRKQEDMLIRLLQDYTDRFYKTLKNAYEAQHYMAVKVSDSKHSGIDSYRIEIKPDDDGFEYEKRLQKLQELVKSTPPAEIDGKWSDRQMRAICFDRHLYYPLLTIDKNLPVSIQPKAFDSESESRFVTDLENFYCSPVGAATLSGRGLYLLRNAASKNKGLGFALAGNFYPDFLLWLVDDESGKQWLSFIDPKGIRQMSIDTDPKFGLYKEVKVLQEKLADPALVLNAFVLSATPITDLLNVAYTEQELEERHLLFMGQEKQTAYLEKMFSRMA